MDRLTKWIDERWAENHDNDTLKWKNGNRACMKKLAHYENTGLTPAEVAELGQAKEEFSHLQQENEQLKELLRLAVGDMSIGWLCAVCSKRTKGKEWAMCQYQAFASVFDEERTVTCANFEWQHADKLKGLIEI